jgi:uncharacterized membrane protein
MKNLLLIKAIAFIILLIFMMSGCTSSNIEDRVDKQYLSLMDDIKDCSITSSGDKLYTNTYYQSMKFYKYDTKSLVYYDSIVYNVVNNEILYRTTTDNRYNRNRTTIMAKN